MGTGKSSVTDVIDTAVELGKHSKYKSAETIVSSFVANTSAMSSKDIAVSSSTVHGTVSIRTVPTKAQCSVDEEQTA